jgi:branched-chain amino acid transport system substrate-binding protein
MNTSSRRRVLPAMLVLALTAAGCSSRLSHDEIVQANGDLSAAAGSRGPDGTAVAGDASVSNQPGGLAAAGGAEGGGAGGDAAGTPNGGPGPDTGATAQGTDAAAPGAAGGPATGAPIVVGNAGSYTGLGTGGLDSAKQALLAWAADLNARGGLKGRPVKLIIKDDGSDAAKARAQVQEMVEKDKVVALVGNLGYTSSADAWQGYLEQKKVPAIGGNGAAKGWTSSPVFFSQASSTDTMYYGAVYLAAKYGTGKTFGSIVCTEDAACTNAKSTWIDKGAARKVGLNPAFSAEVSLAQPDFTAECLQAKNAGVQILGLLLDPATVKRLMASCSQQGYKPQYLLTYSEEAIDTVEFAPDIISAQTQLPFTGIDTATYKSFISVWSKYNKNPPSPYAMTAWASAKIFEKAATDAKEITSAGLIEALYKYRGERFGGFTVPLSYGPRGTTSQNCVFYLHGIDGKWTAPQGEAPVCW